MRVEDLKNLPKTEVLNLIRMVLICEGTSDISDHYRFDMSGYESKTGECTIQNMAILNKFAYLGLYDYTKFLFLDFYKGSPTLYLQYFHEHEALEFDFTGNGTTEIIYEILKFTVLSGKPTRRR